MITIYRCILIIILTSFLFAYYIVKLVTFATHNDFSFLTNSLCNWKSVNHPTGWNLIIHPQVFILFSLFKIILVYYRNLQILTERSGRPQSVTVADFLKNVNPLIEKVVNHFLRKKSASTTPAATSTSSPNVQSLATDSVKRSRM